MKGKNTNIVRTDSEFIEDMKRMSKIRLDKGLAKFNPRELSVAEMTRLLRRTNGYRISLDELSMKPKRGNGQ